VLVRSGLLVAREALLAITSLADDKQSRFADRRQRFGRA
jgi:hypothetical protein